MYAYIKWIWSPINVISYYCYNTVGSVTHQPDQPNPQVSIIIACAVDTINNLIREAR